LFSEKTKGLNFRRPTWPCALALILFTDLTLHQPLRSFDTWTHQRPIFVAVCVSRNARKLFKTLKHFAPIHHFIIFFLTLKLSKHLSKRFISLNHPFPRSIFDHQKVTFLLLPLMLAHFNRFASSINCLEHTLWAVCSQFHFFLHLGFLTLSLRAPLVPSAFFFSVGSLCFQTLISSPFIFFAAFLMARSKVTPNPPPSTQNPPTKLVGPTLPPLATHQGILTSLRARS